MTRADSHHNPQAMIVAGVMSGTSADGVDVALVRIAAAANAFATPRIDLIGHRSFAYSAEVRAHVLAAMDARSTSVAELARLNWRLGEVYAECVAETCSELRVSTPRKPQHAGNGTTLALIGLHGQTIYHQALAEDYAGAAVCATWQTGEAAVVRERVGVPVVSDFRPADLAAGGQGAPLVPMLDLSLFQSTEKARILLNLGGIANVTVLPAAAPPAAVKAFDTGPANMVVDALMSRLYGRAYDAGGEVAATGKPAERVLDQLLQEPYFALAPPKSCGREQFGLAFANRLIDDCRALQCADEDIIESATELTVRSIAKAFDDFCRASLDAGAKPVELIVSGGGARNSFLMKRLTQEFEQRAVRVLLADDLGMPAEAKEAVAFALLAWLSWHGLPGNLPSATGASRPVVLGRVTC